VPLGNEEGQQSGNHTLVEVIDDVRRGHEGNPAPIHVRTIID
jgi:hypothetical protein